VSDLGYQLQRIIHRIYARRPIVDAVVTHSETVRMKPFFEAFLQRKAAVVSGDGDRLFGEVLNHRRNLAYLARSTISAPKVGPAAPEREPMSACEETLPLQRRRAKGGAGIVQTYRKDLEISVRNVGARCGRIDAVFV